MVSKALLTTAVKSAVKGNVDRSRDDCNRVNQDWMKWRLKILELENPVKANRVGERTMQNDDRQIDDVFEDAVLAFLGNTRDLGNRPP